MSSKRHYTREFKIETVQLCDQIGNLKKVSRDLGIHDSLLRKWRKEYNENPSTAFLGKGSVKPRSDKEEELYLLRKEIKDLKLERDILKKAMSIFAKSDR